MSGQHLYMIQSAAGPVKIGRADDPQGRLRTFRTASREELFLRVVIKDHGHRESSLHSLYSDERLRGEWFNGNVLAQFLRHPPIHDLDSIELIFRGVWMDISRDYRSILPLLDASDLYCWISNLNSLAANVKPLQEFIETLKGYPSYRRYHEAESYMPMVIP